MTFEEWWRERGYRFSQRTSAEQAFREAYADITAQGEAERDHLRGQLEKAAAQMSDFASRSESSIQALRDEVENLRSQLRDHTVEDNLRAINAELLEALKRIAYEPMGDAEASSADVLDACAEVAIAAIAKHGGRP